MEGHKKALALPADVGTIQSAHIRELLLGNPELLVSSAHSFAESNSNIFHRHGLSYLAGGMLICPRTRSIML